MLNSKNMRIFVILTTVLALSACSRKPPEVPSQDGAYVVFGQNNKASLVVIQADDRIEVEGTYENETGIPANVGHLLPLSVSGAFKVKTESCGNFAFVLGKGNMLYCNHCTTQRYGPGSKCNFSGFLLSLEWSGVGL